MEKDEMVEEILRVIKSTKEPLETEEVITKIKPKLRETTRTKVMYRLNNLRADGKISGKMLSAGKGVWVWWNKGSFDNVSPSRKT